VNEHAMLQRQKRLQAHVQRYADRPCVWGSSDCCQFAAEWVRRERGIVLALPVYGSESEARQQIAEAGGLEVIWGAVMRPSGLIEALEPVYGDVALIDTERFGAVAVIWAHGGVAAWRGETGVGFIRPRRIISAYRV